MGTRAESGWLRLAGTFLADPATDGEATITAWLDGNYTGGNFYLADVTLLRLNEALLNVVRTDSTDINVTSMGGLEYRNGVDSNCNSRPIFSKWRKIWIRDVFWSQHLGCWGQNTSRIQNKEVYATLCLQVLTLKSSTRP